MKKLFYLIMLLGCAMQAQTVYYTTYDCTTKARGFRQAWEPETGCYTTVECTENWCCATFNTTTQLWFNNATSQQQSDYLATQEAQGVDCETMVSMNYSITVMQTNTQLNLLYSCQQEGFKLICPNVVYPGFQNSQTEYTKQRNGIWGRNFSFKN